MHILYSMINDLTNSVPVSKHSYSRVKWLTDVIKDHETHEILLKQEKKIARLFWSFVFLDNNFTLHRAQCGNQSGFSWSYASIAAAESTEQRWAPIIFREMHH